MDEFTLHRCSDHDVPDVDVATVPSLHPELGLQPSTSARPIFPFCPATDWGIGPDPPSTSSCRSESASAATWASGSGPTSGRSATSRNFSENRTLC